MHVRNACVWFWRETRLLTQIFLRKIEHSPLMCLIYLLTLLSLLLSWQIRPVRAGIAEISVLDEEYAENGEDRYPTAFGIMMDAGSTGTRFLFFLTSALLFDR